MVLPRRDRSAFVLFVSAIAVVAGLLFLTSDTIPWRAQPIQWYGWGLILSGTVIILWAVSVLRSGVVGRIEPRRLRIVTHGAYRYIRHPVYVGLVLVLLGVSLRLRSWPGIAATALLFLPCAVYRARREEHALEERFGGEWTAYRKATGFMIPRFQARKG